MDKVLAMFLHVVLLVTGSKGQTCDEWKFQCSNGECLSPDKFCNGIDDCGDNSDEISPASEEETGTLCRQWFNICKLPIRENETRYCTANLTCSDNEFSCNDGSGCIPPNRYCDEWEDCRDGSDEIRFNISAQPASEGSACRGRTSIFGICALDKQNAHKHATLCKKGDSCSEEEYQCTDKSQCIPLSWFCDGIRDCSDGSDENLYIESEYNDEDGIPCRGSRSLFRRCVLPRSQISKNDTICVIGNSCSDDEFRCLDGSGCVLSTFCDGKSDCNDGSDELPYKTATSKEEDGISCRAGNVNNVCLLEANQSRKHGSICTRGYNCTENEFACLDGSFCISISQYCDGHIDCPDGSDELVYEGQKLRGEIECDALDGENSDKRCLLPKRYLCDGINHCNDGVDECLCESRVTVNEHCFRCLNHPAVIKFGYLCDGILHCPDLSDECICRKRGNLPEICENVEWTVDVGDLTNTMHHSKQWTCAYGNSSDEFGNSSRTLMTTEICDGNVDCSDSLDENNCETICSEGSKCDNYYSCLNQDKYAVQCDGILSCRQSMVEECVNCVDPPAFCQGLSWANDYQCHDGTKIAASNICNGVKNCLPDGEEEKDCPNRFYCDTGNTIHVLKSMYCNGQKDCDDSSDEMNCGNETHFYCNDTGEPKFVAQGQVCDGSEDCSGGKDECLDRCISSVFSNVDLMISDRTFVALTWIISLVALIGNLVVAGRSIRNIFFPKKMLSKNELINKTLIFNLSLSDLLVGIYTASVCIKNATITKDYCRTDRKWRSGTTCSALGALLLIGSENSVFTLTIITGYRMKAVLRPYASATPMKLVICMVAFSWFFSLLLGLIPISSGTREFFVDSIWYEKNPLFSTIDRAQVEPLTRWLLTKENRTDQSTQGSIGSWSLLESLIHDLNPDYKVKRRFGYYSTHGVCLPTLFPDPMSDAAWPYSLFIIIVNFSAFFFILIGYIKIYRSALQRNVALDDKAMAKRAERMQRKVTRIVVTDFLCWMPICIMAFLQVFGVHIPKDAYVPVSLIIIPINSALNPFLYSDAPDYIWEKLAPARHWIYRMSFGKIHPDDTKNKNGTHSSSESTALSQRTQNTATSRVQETSGDPVNESDIETRL